MPEQDNLVELFAETLIGQHGSAENTVKSYVSDLQDFKKFIGRIPFKAVVVANITDYMELLHDQKKSNKTICRHLSTLRQFYNFLTEEQLINLNPTLYIDNPSTAKSLPKFLDIQSVFKIFQATEMLKYPESLRAKLIMHFLYGSGLRVSEALDLKVNSISFDGRHVLVLGKGGRERVVPVPKQLLFLVKEWTAQNKLISTSWLFPSNVPKRRLTRQRIFQIIKTLADFAGIDQNLVSPHVMRHAFATHLVNNGADLFSVKKMLGHQSITTTEIYTHVSNEKMRAELLATHPLSKKT
ncbi:MAG: tyrosine-type recombinase/integrase [Holosporales bacterium]|jgi:integrase/recombinase XerD|nr:tyrosine-type recombinase/integrase [Holosporales bacterium]